VDIEIYLQADNGRGDFYPCDSQQGAFVGSRSRDPVTAPYDLTRFTGLSGQYCYRMRNNFTSYIGGHYGGEWSSFSDFIY
jgi:hypothetical protein